MRKTHCGSSAFDSILLEKFVITCESTIDYARTTAVLIKSMLSDFSNTCGEADIISWNVIYHIEISFHPSCFLLKNSLLIKVRRVALLFFQKRLTGWERK